MGIGNRIKEARDLYGLTQSELGKMVGVTGSAITNYENNLSHPKEQILYKLMDALKVDANYLFQDEMPTQENNSFSAEEQRHILDFRKLDTHGKKAVKATMSVELERVECECVQNENEKSEKIIHMQKREVPLYDVRVSAGTGQFLDSSSYTMVELEDNEPPETSFLVNVTGDSMEPTYFAGDTLYIKQQREIELGEIGIFMINGDIFVKELSEGGLKSHNSVYPVIPFSSTDTIHCYGKVLGIREI